MSAPSLPENGRSPARVRPDGDRPATVAHASALRPCPMVAACGLCGGAGTSTLAYLLARYAVLAGPGHVLVADTGGPTGGLAAAARTDSGRTLAEAGELLEHDLPLAPPLYAVDADTGTAHGQLRVLATGPRLKSTARPQGAASLLTVARHPQAHALVIVDAGTLQRAADRFVARHASHRIWVLPATAGAVERGAAVLEAFPAGDGRELVVARRDPGHPAASQRALIDLADRRHAPLILFPHVDDITRRPTRALDAADVSLQAILGLLER